MGFQNSHRPEPVWLGEVVWAGVHAAYAQEQQRPLGHLVATNHNILCSGPAGTTSTSTMPLMYQ